MSRTASKSINYSIFQLIKTKSGHLSFESRNGMTKRLTQMAKELQELGFILRNINSLKQKHISALVEHWKTRELSTGTIKNRMADLRFVCRAQGRDAVVKSNEEYGIENRSYAPTQNKATQEADFSNIQDPYLKLSLELQKAFGLRREECLKIIPALADQGDHLWLKGSWTKGNVERLVPIRTETQRELLNKAKAFVKDGSLIPSDKKYIQQRNLYEKETRALGFKNLHGLRHAYAQMRYQELTGSIPPINGGKKRSTMNLKEKRLDLFARTKISHELGHSRSSITKTYIG
jgi:integrase